MIALYIIIEHVLCLCGSSFINVTMLSQIHTKGEELNVALMCMITLTYFHDRIRSLLVHFLNATPTDMKSDTH